MSTRRAVAEDLAPRPAIWNLDVEHAAEGAKRGRQVGEHDRVPSLAPGVHGSQVHGNGAGPDPALRAGDDGQAPARLRSPLAEARAPLEHHLEARHQFARLDRLDEVIVGAEFERPTLPSSSSKTERTTIWMSAPAG